MQIENRKLSNTNCLLNVIASEIWQNEHFPGRNCKTSFSFLKNLGACLLSCGSGRHEPQIFKQPRLGLNNAGITIIIIGANVVFANVYEGAINIQDPLSSLCSQAEV